ncbi:hypothetical protein [Corallococcus carmarthensis]|uniref:DUF4398 domain-containing protein n=1 Tax=Corallococcus carmarthensis TaxID=2316728 RepID=A0A3A8JHB6_9BACT|nr:hypothetical protein [Corallococcus carmarthensis]RKG95172.1 hypothetical protein D7X32_39855 [Corallococcus carmarthensis]
MRIALLTVTLLVAAPAWSQDALTPTYLQVETLARNREWAKVLDVLASLDITTVRDHRYFYWRAVAFYHRGWLEAGDAEARVAEKFLAAQLTDSAREQAKKNLSEARKASERLRASADTLCKPTPLSCHLVLGPSGGGGTWNVHDINLRGLVEREGNPGGPGSGPGNSTPQQSTSAGTQRP